MGYLGYYNRTHSKDILRKEIRKKIRSLCWQTVDKGIVCSKLKTQGRRKFKFQILLRNSEPLRLGFADHGDARYTMWIRGKQGKMAQ